MRRTFVLNLALVLVLNLLVKPFYILGIDAGVQVKVGSSVYGVYAALLSLSVLLNIVLDLGITNWNTRNIAQHGQLMRKHLSGILGVRIVLAVLYALVSFAVAAILGYSHGQFMLLAILVLNQALASLLLYLRSNIAGAQRFAQDSLLSVLDRALLILMVGWLLWGREPNAHFDITWFAWAQTVAYGAAVLVALFFTLRLSGRVGLKWNAPFSYVVLRQSAPFALLILLMTFYYRTDTIMLERMLPDGPIQAGIYAQGFRFFEAFNMLGYLVAGLLLPMFSRMIKEKVEVASLTGLAWRLMLAGSLAVAVTGSVYAREIMDLRYPEHAAAGATAFSVLIWCFVAVGTTYVFGTLLTAGGDLRALNMVAAGGMLLNIGLNLWLIPHYQALGAAWASLITQGLTAIAQILLARGRFAGLLGSAGMIRAAAYLAGLLFLAWCLRRSSLDALPAMMLMGGFALVWSLLTGLVGTGSLRSLLAAREGV